MPHVRFRERDLEYSGPGHEEAAVEDTDEVLIGWFGPPDPDHPMGGPLWEAASLAIEEANAAGGYGGKPFRLVARWSDNPWGTGVALLARLVYTDRVLAIVGSIDGPSTHLAEQVVAKARLPLVSPVATDKSVNLAGVSWMFSCAPGDHLWAPALVEEVLESAGDLGTICLVAATDHDSRLAAGEILAALARRGRVVDRRLDFRPRQQELDVQLDALLSAAPRAVIIVADGEDSARCVRALRSSRLPAAVFGTPRMAERRFLEMAGDAAEGIRFPLLASLNPDEPAARWFAARFRERTGRRPGPPSLLAYDATRLVIEALRRSGLNRARLRDAIAGLRSYRGIGGDIRWDPTGQNQRPVTRLAVIGEGECRLDASPEE